MNMTKSAVSLIQFIYLHGFNSGFNPEAQKTKELLALSDKVIGFTTNYLIPEEVNRLEAQLIQAVNDFQGESIIVGTSLGGYFARYFSKKFCLRVILLNPAVAPYESLLTMVGPQKNYFTGASYTVSKAEIMDLARYETTEAEDCLMILATDDTVIPYMLPLKRYGSKAKVVVTTGGHRLESLNKVTAEISAFINSFPTNDNSF